MTTNKMMTADAYETAFDRRCCTDHAEDEVTQPQCGLCRHG